MSDMFKRAMPMPPGIDSPHLPDFVHGDAPPAQGTGPAGLVAAQAQRTRSMATRGTLPTAATRVWKALAQDVRHIVDAGSEEFEAGDIDDEKRADTPSHRKSAASSASMPCLLEAPRDPGAGAATMARAGGGAHEGEGDGHCAGAVAAPDERGSKRTRSVPAGSDAGDAGPVDRAGSVKQVAILAPVDRATAPRPVDRRGRDAGRGTLQAMRWGVGVAVAVVAFCVAWLLIDPREPAGEARHSGAAERCEGTAASCAK